MSYCGRTALQSSPAVPIDSVEWLRRPWDEWEADPTFDFNTFNYSEWEGFATSALPAFAYGAPPLGHWAITAKVNFFGTFAVMTAVLQRQVNGIVETRWVKGDPDQRFEGDGLIPSRVFPERDRPSTDPASVLHDKLKINVSLAAPVAAGMRGLVHLEVVDPDHAYTPEVMDTAYIPDRNDTLFPLAKLPNDNIASSGTGAQVPNFGGQLLDFFPLEFVAGDQQRNRLFQITAPQPGNNFRAVAFPHAGWIAGIHFHSDGVQLLKEGGALVPTANSTGVVTVWRTLHLELDAMVAPDPATDGPFDGQPGADDDPQPLFDLPFPSIIMFDPKYEAANIDVKADLQQWNTFPLHTFRHDFGPTDAIARDAGRIAGNAKHEIRSEDTFWTIQLVTAYEYAEDEDDDPNAEAAAYGINLGFRSDGPTYIFYEAIRDLVAHDPGCGMPPTPMSFQEQLDRTSYHESIHRFNMNHGEAGGIGDEGGLNTDVNDCGTDADHNLTSRQIARIQTVDRPR